MNIVGRNFMDYVNWRNCVAIWRIVMNDFGILIDIRWRRGLSLILVRQRFSGSAASLVRTQTSSAFARATTNAFDDVIILNWQVWCRVCGNVISIIDNLVAPVLCLFDDHRLVANEQLTWIDLSGLYTSIYGGRVLRSLRYICRTWRLTIPDSSG